MKSVFLLFFSIVYIIHYGKFYRAYGLDTEKKTVKDKLGQILEIVEDNIEKSPIDTSTYRVVKTANGLEALLKSTPDTHKSYIIISVNAGVIDDPGSYTGLAHLLEHVLFLGSDKFPDPYFEMSYFHQRGGKVNARTSVTKTDYYFSFSPTFLSEALEIVSGYLVKPLFTNELVEAEAYAVDSEYTGAIREYKKAFLNLCKTSFNSSHPYSRFSVGSYNTLVLEARRQNTTIKDVLITFYEKYYHAENIKMVIHGNNSIDELQELFSLYFSKVPKKTVENLHVEVGSPFDGVKKSLRYIETDPNTSSALHLFFPVDYKLSYTSQPYQYLRYLLTFSGKGSIKSYLRSNNFARGFEVSITRMSRNVQAFEILMSLPSYMSRKITEPMKALFKCLDFYKKNGIKKEIFDELYKIQNMEFNISSAEDVDARSIELAELMHDSTLPRSMLLTSNIIREYNETDISKLFDVLKHDNFRAVLEYTGTKEYTHKDPYYHIRYMDTVMDDADIKKLEPKGFVPDLGFPKNRFITTFPRITMNKSDPILLLPKPYKETDLTTLWYLHSSAYLVPCASVTFMLRSPLQHLNIIDKVNFDFISNYLNFALSLDSYYYYMAGFSFGFSNTYHGVKVFIKGYSDRILEIFDEFLKVLTTITTSMDFYLLFKDSILRKYVTHLVSPSVSSVMSPKILSLFHPHHYNARQLYYELQVVTPEVLSLSFNSYFTNFHIDLLILGNILPELSIHIFNMLRLSFTKVRRLYFHEDINPRGVLLPEGSNYYITDNYADLGNPNSGIYYLIQVDPKELVLPKRRAALNILSKIFYVQSFVYLRSKKQFGYVIQGSSTDFATVYGLRILFEIRTHPYIVETEILSFLKYLYDYVETISDQEIANYIESSLASITSFPKGIHKETDYLWDDIYYSVYYDSQILKKAHDVYSSVTKQDIVDLYRSCFYNDTKLPRRKLSIHLVSFYANNYYIRDIPHDSLVEFYSSIGISVEKTQLESIQRLSYNTTIFVESVASYLEKTGLIKKESVNDTIEKTYSFLKDEFKKVLAHHKESVGNEVPDELTFIYDNYLSYAKVPHVQTGKYFKRY